MDLTLDDGDGGGDGDDDEDGAAVISRLINV
jgi:hypothetical protein